MKKSVFILGLAMLSGSLFAQKADVTSAVLAYRKKDWNAAKKYIDIAQDKLNNGSTLKSKDMSKFLHYKGLIYLELAKDESNTDPSFLTVAADAFNKDAQNNGNNKKNSIIYLNQCAARYNNKAFDYYEAKQYEEAMNTFEKTIEIRAYPAINLIDTASILNASIMAQNGKMYDKAIAHTNHLIQLDASEAQYHRQLINLYNLSEDKDGAFKAIQAARKAVPTDIEVIYSLVNYYLDKGDNEALKSSLLSAIEQDPENSTLYFVLGNAYSGLGEVDKAKESYEKSIEIDPNNFDAYNNLASFYLGQASKKTDEMNKLDFSAASKKKYAVLEKERNALYGEAVPYLAKAVELNPQSVEVMTALREVYYQLDNTEGYKEINAKIKALQGK